MEMKNLFDIRKTRKPMFIISIIAILVGVFAFFYFNYSYSNAYIYDVQFESDVIIDGQTESLTIDAVVLEAKSAPMNDEISNERPLVVLIHGFSMSKEFMLSIGMELARRGVSSISISMPGHGNSDAPYYFANASPYCAISAMDYMINDNPNLHYAINESMVGIIGHSMGAMTAIKASKLDTRFNFTIAVASPGGTSTVMVDNPYFYLDFQSTSMANWVNQTNPRNLLFIRGAIDELVYEEDAQTIMQAATGESYVEPGVLYNEDFVAGTSRKYAFFSAMDHATEVYDPRSLQEMMDWTAVSWGISANVFNGDLGVSGGVIRPLLFIVAIVGSFGLFWPTSSYLSDKLFKSPDLKLEAGIGREQKEGGNTPVKTMFASIMVYFVLAGIIPTLIAPFLSLPWPLTGNSMTDSPLPIFFIGGMLCMIFAALNKKFGWIDVGIGKHIQFMPATIPRDDKRGFVLKYVLFVVIGILPSMLLITIFWSVGLFQITIPLQHMWSFLLAVVMLLPITFAHSILLKSTIYPFLRSRLNGVVARILLPVLMGLVCGLTLSIPLALTVGAPMAQGLQASFIMWIFMMAAILVIVEFLYGGWLYVVDNTIYATSIVPAFFMIILMFAFPMSAAI